MNVKKYIILAGTALLLSAAVPAISKAGKKYLGPANPDDLRVNRLWDDDVRVLGMDTGNGNGVIEPMFSTLTGKSLYIPHTKQVENGRLSNLLSRLSTEAIGADSSTGHAIESTLDPHRDLFFATNRLVNSARLNRVDQKAAEDMLDVLLGRTQGKIYDGFPLLNFNRFNSPDVPDEAFTPDTLPGQYKMKQIRLTGEIEPSWKEDGTQVNIWEIDVNYFWYDQQFDSDTFLVKVPRVDPVSGVVPSPDDTLRVNYHIYSLVEEDFAPTQVMLDAQVGVEFPDRSSVRFPYKGQDTVWVRILPKTVNHLTVQHTALRFFRGIYTWGWNVHPPRIHFLQFLFETVNEHTGQDQFDAEGQSFSLRNGELSIDDIGEAAPEKKLYEVAKAALSGTVSAGQLLTMLNDPKTPPLNGNWIDWIGLMSNQRQLPPEARQILADDGKAIDDYDFVTVYANNEMYGEGVLGHTIRPWSQGETMTVKLINLDNHTHYFRNVGSGPTLNNDLSASIEDGVFSFEVMNFKPLYGAPKVAEVQWRAGWGFRPHYSVIQQSDVFPRESDQRQIRAFVAPNLRTGQMEVYQGYQYSEKARKGDFPFNPPRFIIGNPGDESFETLYDVSDFALPWLNKKSFFRLVLGNWDVFKSLLPLKNGIIIGQQTEGYGVGKMCPDDPLGTFCQSDLSPYHPQAKKNFPAPNDNRVPKTELRFPPFLRNPNPSAGGDIIPPTGLWKPFLFLSPTNGTIYIDPEDKSKGYWTDLTYAHGRTIFRGESLLLTIEMPRSAGQLFYQFDDLFHDNDIFSPHPIK